MRRQGFEVLVVLCKAIRLIYFWGLSGDEKVDFLRQQKEMGANGSGSGVLTTLKIQAGSYGRIHLIVLEVI